MCKDLALYSFTKDPTVDYCVLAILQVRDSVVGAGKSVNEAFKTTVREYTGTEDYTVVDNGRIMLHADKREELLNSRASPAGGLLGLPSNTATLRARGAAV